MLESVLGCKWSLTVLALVRGGVCRPGAMEHAVPGLSKKVLNERLRKFVRYGVLSRHAYAELPPRVEYRLTPFGERFAVLVDGVDALQRELDGES
ncbi:MAG: helix-turn-helix transcriptional regulator [Frateuria sp.]|nr:helix-turn-helix transcriptional regulator [Frateuria sp.]